MDWPSRSSPIPWRWCFFATGIKNSGDTIPNCPPLPRSLSRELRRRCGFEPFLRDNDAFAWGSHYAVARPYTTNGLNQYIAATGGPSFAYDLNGNLTGDGVHAYTYDIENRLVMATGGGAGAVLDYDPLGRLWARGDSYCGGPETCGDRTLNSE
ncbi:MAG: hypothetical protein E6G92_01300 [Alphaproteobacteria bacterium]|nr:MAG: hypothetical protein E6G92_01300 [Alphaproteobacteria bacterium]